MILEAAKPLKKAGDCLKELDHLWEPKDVEPGLPL